MTDATPTMTLAPIVGVTPGAATDPGSGATTDRATFLVTGTDPRRLHTLRCNGSDDRGLPVRPFTDTDGGWALRCCLRDSEPGDLIAIVAWAPSARASAYATVGPVVVHAVACTDAVPVLQPGTVPAGFEERRQVLRSYDERGVLLYDHVRIVESGDGLAAAIRSLLGHPEVDVVESFNVEAGCWSFTARRC